MPLDVLGRTRATLTKSASMSYADRCGESCETSSCWGLIIEILDHQLGIPSKSKSAACVDYVPAFCTHCPSLLPIEWFSEISGLVPPSPAMDTVDIEKLIKLEHLEEVKVVPGKLSYLHVHSFGFEQLQSEFRSSQFQIFWNVQSKTVGPRW